AEQSMAETEPDAALHLGADDIRVHRHTAVDRAPHLVHARLAIALRRHFRNLRDEAAEALDHGNAARASVHWTWARPSGELRNGAQHAGRARRIAHHGETAGHRVLAGRLQQLVHEAFDR